MAVGIGIRMKSSEDVFKLAKRVFSSLSRICLPLVQIAPTFPLSHIRCQSSNRYTLLPSSLHLIFLSPLSLFLSRPAPAVLAALSKTASLHISVSISLQQSLSLSLSPLGKIALHGFHNCHRDSLPSPVSPRQSDSGRCVFSCLCLSVSVFEVVSVLLCLCLSLSLYQFYSFVCVCL